MGATSDMNENITKAVFIKDLQKKIQTYLYTVKESSDLVSPTATTLVEAGLTKKSEGLGEVIEPKKPNTSNDQPRKLLTCLRCGEAGHFARNPRCTMYKEKGEGISRNNANYTPGKVPDKDDDIKKGENVLNGEKVERIVVVIQ